MCVSIVIIRAIAAELQNRNIDPDPLLLEIGIDRQTLRDIRVVVPLERVQRLVTRALAVSEEPALGLFTGMHTAHATLQMVGPLLETCVTLREAIHYFQRYAGLFARGVRWRFNESMESSELGLQLDLPHGEVATFFTEFALTLIVRLTEHFRPNAEIRATEVRLSGSTRTAQHVYAEALGCSTLLEAERSCVRFPSDLLDVPQLHADPILRGMFIEAAERMLHERTGKTTTERVRIELRYQTDPSKLTAKCVARSLGVTPRILRRRLQLEGTTLTTLTSEERLRAAYEALKNRERSIKDIAEGLGFSEPSAFHRAFKRWTGITPSQYSRRAG